MIRLATMTQTEQHAAYEYGLVEVEAPADS
jgi:hypothetical protein